MEHLVVARFSDKAFDVFAALRQKGAPAAPVVDIYGAMAANISFSDVKAIAKKANFSALQLPISQFFTAIEKGSEVCWYFRCVQLDNIPPELHGVLGLADHEPFHICQSQHNIQQHRFNPCRHENPPVVLCRRRIAPCWNSKGCGPFEGLH
jgi:hypothetical protein